MKKKILLLWILIFFCFAAIEFPGIFFINRIEPRLFGLPFIYGFTLIVWFVLCILMYAGYLMKWGYRDKYKNKKGG
jgi:predicted membrane protein